MSINDNYVVVQERIAKAAARSDRKPEEVTLVAVTKTWPAETVINAYQIGLRNFGENRPEELSEKWAEVNKVLGKASEIIWHAIGPVQSRKTNLVADYADVFHALDRLKVANRLSRRLVEAYPEGTKSLPIYLEVNISGEASKAGIDCRNWEEDGSQRETLQQIAVTVAELSGLAPQGLMTMAPWRVGDDVIREVFQRTRRLSEWLQKAVPQAEWLNLSMGMTDDFEIAIEEGATHVRVGRALFGSRE
jgi:pyridoxal phosphate enzyme (YggS family)